MTSTPLRMTGSFPVPVALFLIVAILVTSVQASAEVPRVVVSLRPLHSLVHSIMKNVGEPELLLAKAASPHDARLRPSQVRSLAQADLVVWIGGAMESSIASTMENLSAGKAIIAVLDLPELTRLAARAGGVWGDDDHGHHHDGKDDGHIDPHAWLSTINARVIARAVAATLSRLDTANASTYEANQARLLTELDSLSDDLRSMLSPFGESRYVTLHDSFQYLEQQFGLTPVGALSPTAGTSPGARRIQDLRAEMKQRDVRCIAADPFAASAYIGTLRGNRKTRVITMDPMGLDIPPGPGHFALMMKQNASALASCLRLP